MLFGTVFLGLGFVFLFYFGFSSFFGNSNLSKPDISSESESSSFIKRSAAAFGSSSGDLAFEIYLVKIGEGNGEGERELTGDRKVAKNASSL